MSSHPDRPVLQLLRTLLMGAVVMALAASPLLAQDNADLGQMSIEDLMKVDVTSVSRRAQHLQDAAAAIYVLTSEDIRRSGATTIPELLRLVPGVHVARIDSNKWSVSVRGFTGRYANKLLVLIDGRSVYTPLFSGVIWDVVGVPLDTIERIEVIRGPGATLWGANAVNGVINIITRSATASGGGRAMVATGSEDRGMLTVSAGSQVTPRTAVRADVSLSATDGSTASLLSGREGDDWKNLRLGIRTDSRLSDRDDLVVQGAYAGTRINDEYAFPSLTPPFVNLVDHRTRHANSFGAVDWTHRQGPSQTSVHGIVEYSDLHEGFAAEERMTFQLEAQRTQQIGQRQTAVLGATYRQSADDLTGTTWANFSPATRTLRWQSLFAQDDVALAGERLRLTAGLKLEHNDYTGWETQPNLRSIVSVTSKQSVWAAVSRAVRLPSRGEADGRLWLLTAPLPTLPLPAVVLLQGLGANADAERLTAVEGGYRYQVGNVASFDISVFRQRYQQLRSTSVPTVSFGAGAQLDGLGVTATGVDLFAASPHMDALVPLAFDAGGQRHGLEVSADWRPRPRVRITGGASLLGGQDTDASSTPSAVPSTDDPPRYVGVVRAALNLPAHAELDLTLRHVSRLHIIGVPAYTTADARLGFRLSSVNLAVVGRNLLARDHQEFVAEFFSVPRAAAERAVLVQATFGR
ncbi:MAG: TonB-dependent receptor plug domain-containing protein [Vicinamibacterales bacterium]